LQDPLAELVKIDPKSIGVGQYQHDVNQTHLKKRLDEVVESCVNLVGVDLNSASESLLGYVSGINKPLARNIVNHRNENGAFKSREDLSKVTQFGPKALEQAAGFLRIPDAENPLDASAVHPENYELVKEMAKDAGVEIKDLIGNKEVLKNLDIEKYISEEVGKHTLEDILLELEKPNRDPRSKFAYAHFNEKIQTINDLITGSWMEGVVTNVTNFGAFVDLGVHQDALIHVSEMADKFIEDAKTLLKVGDVVKVRVLAVDVEQKRIAISMKSDSPAPAQQQNRRGGPQNKGGIQRAKEKATQGNATIADLKLKFQGGKPGGKGGQAPAERPKVSIKSLMRSGR
jgi:protein Tex